MTALPNPMVALVDAQGYPTRALMGVLPTFGATSRVVDASGLPSREFRDFMAAQTGVLPNATVPLTLKDGTPTRSMTYLLMGVI